MSEEYKDKRVVVTGGARGIGACLVETFARAGARVAFSDADNKAGKSREKSVRSSLPSKNKDRVFFVPADMAKEKDVRKFCKAALAHLGGVDVLINNVGIGSGTKFAERPLAQWDRVLAVNLRAAYLCAQLLAGSLAARKGSIINIASTRAIQSEADTEPYSASKGGLRALTHSLAVTLGRQGVRVNCVSPGWIDTSRWQVPPGKLDITRADREQHPAGRVGRPEDIAEACLFLASSLRAGFITGQNLVVDGGMTVKMIYVE